MPSIGTHESDFDASFALPAVHVDSRHLLVDSTVAVMLIPFLYLTLPGARIPNWTFPILSIFLEIKDSKSKSELLFSFLASRISDKISVNFVWRLGKLNSL